MHNHRPLNIISLVVREVKMMSTCSSTIKIETVISSVGKVTLSIKYITYYSLLLGNVISCSYILLQMKSSLYYIKLLLL